MSCYILFYKKNIDEDYQFLICRSFHGLKINNKEIFTYYKTSREGGIKPPDVLKDEIDKQVDTLQKIEENGRTKYPNVRLKKHTENSAYYICDDVKCSGTNLLGGQQNIDETPIDCLLRELHEEIFLNFDEKTKKDILNNISEYLIDSNKITIGKIIIYFVDFNNLSVLTKSSLNNIYENPTKFLSKKINLYSVYDLEIGEIQSLEWINFDKLKIKLPYKFYKLIDFIQKKINLKQIKEKEMKTSKSYRYKYSKYKTKYLELKKILTNF